MGESAGPYEAALLRADAHARHWLATVQDRPVRPGATVDELLAGFGELPDGPVAAEDVVDHLAAAVEPGLMAMGSGRFFGWVVGGTLPAALAADWMVSAWDQNVALRVATPGVIAAEETAARWLLDLFGLPADAGLGFVTGATMAHFVGLATGRDQVLKRAGWDVASKGLAGAPSPAVIVGGERHDTVDLALKFLGLGAPIEVEADHQGRLRAEKLEDALKKVAGRPTIVCLQAGNLHSGAFDPFEPAIAAAHDAQAWVHVDGAFGIWATVVPEMAPLVAGMELADSWSGDAHKTLNVPYDCGLAIVADHGAMRESMGAHGDYLIEDAMGDPQERVPELSRRARGVPTWAALASLGRSGVTDLVRGLHHNAVAIAEGIAQIDGAKVLNDVVYTQVCVAFEDNEITRAVTDYLMKSGEVWMSGSRWQGHDVVRVSVSNWSTCDYDVERSVTAVAAARSAVA